MFFLRTTYFLIAPTAFRESFAAAHTTSEWTVNSLGYCSARISNGRSVMYMNCWAPADASTQAPGLVLDPATPQELEQDRITRKTMEAFWFGLGSNTHKRRWGRNNLSLTSKSWCSGMFIGDTIQFLDFREGIIPSRSHFDANGPIIPGSESWAVTALVQVHGKAYKVYLTKGPMPQQAIDVILIVRINGKLWVKILKRGTDFDTVDNPELLMSGAGEHCEPGTGNLKAQTFDALFQETGVHKNDLKKSSFYVIGHFNKHGRDPRYWKFSAIDEDTGARVEFGYERESSTTVNLIFIDYGDSGDKPIKTEPTDGVEVAQTYWLELDKAILLDPSEFFLRENHHYLELAREYIHSNGL